VESVSGCSWNECPDQRGITVRMCVEWVSESAWNPHFWKNLPEGSLIPQLMSRARAGGQRDGQAERVANRPGKRIDPPRQPD